MVPFISAYPLVISLGVLIMAGNMLMVRIFVENRIHTIVLMIFNSLYSCAALCEYMSTPSV